MKYLTRTDLTLKIFSPQNHKIMQTKKLLVSGFAGGVVLFILGWLIYGMLLMNFFTQNAGTATGVNKNMEEMNMGMIFLGNLAWGFLLALIVGKWAKAKDFSSGLQIGLLIGFLLGTGYDLLTFGTTHIMNMTATITDIIVGTVMFGITAGVIGIINGTTSKTAMK